MIPLAALKDYLGIGAEDTSEDTALTELERNAVAFIETQTRRYFGPPELAEEILDGSGTRKLWLSEPPVAEDEYEWPLVTVEEVSVPGATPTTIEQGAEDGFEVRIRDREGLLVRWGGKVWRRGSEYTVSYFRGYAMGSEPGDIRQLVLGLVSLRRNQRGAEGVRSESLAGGEYSYTRFSGEDLAAIPGAQATIDAWRRLVYA